MAQRYMGLAHALLLAGLLLQGLCVLAQEDQSPEINLNLKDQSISGKVSDNNSGSSDTSLSVVQNYVYYVDDLRVVKCHCGADEVLAPDGACQYYSGGTSLDTEEGEVPTAWAHNTIKDIQCPQHQSPLNFSRGEIHLRQRGDLVVQTGVMKGLRVAHYCLTHHLNKEGALTWTARTCIAPPSIPRCCPPGQIMLEGGCVHAPSNAPKRWSPPLSAGPLEPPISWPVLRENLTHPICTHDPLIELPLEYPNHMVALPKGVLLIWESGSGQTVYTVKDYCIDGHLTASGATSYSAYLCYSDPAHVHEKVCKGTTCVRKCCPQGEAFSEYFFRCVPTDAGFLPRFVEEPADYTLVTGGPLCSGLDTRVELEDYILSVTGQMEVLGLALPPTAYCVDSFITGNGTVSHKAHVCLSGQAGGHYAGSAWLLIQAQLLPVLLAISCVFLCLLVAAFALVPELRAAEGSYQLSHVTSLLASFTAYFLLQVFSSLYNVHYMVCMFLAVVVHFGFLAAYFWLSILCADLWRRVRHLKSFSLGATCTPFLYHLLGWGGPTAIISISVGLHFMIPNASTGELNAGFNEDRCWFAGTTEMLVYFYSPIAVLVLISIILVALSYWKSRTMGQESISMGGGGGREGSSVGNENSATGTSQLRPGLDFSAEVRYYVCLVTVSAFWWITEGLAIQIGPPELWSIAEIINALHGLIVSIIFLLNPNKRRIVVNRLKRCCGCKQSSAVDIAAQHSDTQGNTTSPTRCTANR